MTTLNLYGCGGTGINIAMQFQKFAGLQDPGFCKMQTYYIDTSSSNTSSNSSSDNTFIVDGLFNNKEGSGKVRGSNYDPISERSKEILHKFKPGNVNIVIHSGSGGSGSVIGPVLVSELLARDETVIVLMVGTTSSRIEIDNTKKTLVSYENISQKRGKPVICFYRENSKETPRGAVDNAMQVAVVILAAIFSGENRELDSADLSNWLNYNRVTGYTPKLNLLEFSSTAVALGKNQTLISLATLTDDKSHSDADIPVEYQCVGYLGDQAASKIGMKLPIHACIVGGFFTDAVNKLTERIKMFDEIRATVVEKSIAKDMKSDTDDGLVL
jgi:hypothetical protein